MATKSFLKTVSIKDKKSCYALINALESSEKKSAKLISPTPSYHIATDEEIINMFGSKK